MIKLVEVSKVYRRGPETIQALDHLSLQIDSGEFVAITGKSGCGKSTLLHIIGGLEPVSGGRVFLDGRDLAARLVEPELTQFRRDRVGVVFQSFNLLPLLTLEENVALPRVLQGAIYEQAQQEAANWLAGGGFEQPPGPQAPPGLRRRAAAGRHCPGPGEPAGSHSGRRTHREPGFRHCGPDTGALFLTCTANGAKPSSW